MKASLLATVSSLALAGAASAADLPAAMPTKAPPASPVAWNWAGPYVGINGGAVWHRAKFDGVDDVATYSASTTPVGATFGAQIGHNWRWQNWVYGIEADWNWVGAKGSTGVSNWTNGVFTTKLSWLATVRGRAGILLQPSTLLYATGGYAAGRVVNDTNAADGFHDRSTRSGWTAGGGIERAFARQWTVKAEALYVDLGSSTVQGAFSGYVATFKNSAVIARIGANYKF